MDKKRILLSQNLRTSDILSRIPPNDLISLPLFVEKVFEDYIIHSDVIIHSRLCPTLLALTLWARNSWKYAIPLRFIAKEEFLKIHYT